MASAPVERGEDPLDFGRAAARGGQPGTFAAVSVDVRHGISRADLRSPARWGSNRRTTSTGVSGGLLQIGGILRPGARLDALPENVNVGCAVPGHASFGPVMWLRLAAHHVAFNPFELRIIRVMDSAGRQLMLDVVSPAADIGEVSRRHLDRGRPRTALGHLMADLGAGDLRDLSPMMSGRSGRWVEVYRDLCEWATLYDLVCRRDFVTDTLIVRDGLLRAKIFASDLFLTMGRRMQAAIERTAREDRRRVWIVGLAKRSAVLDHYRLAMSLAGIFDRGSPCFVKVPEALQEKVYRWDEYLRGPEETGRGGELPKFNLGEMHFVRFGARPGDPIWTADLLAWQAGDAQAIFGHLLADAVAGFPVPFYPCCLQQADTHSHVANLDLEIVQDSLVEAVRDLVGPDHVPVVGVFRGFSDSGLEFHADLVLPYRDDFQSIPMHGQFVLIQLEHEEEAVLGRITAAAAEGRLVSSIGEDYAIRAVRDERPIPDELRDQVPQVPGRHPGAGRGAGRRRQARLRPQPPAAAPCGRQGRAPVR